MIYFVQDEPSGLIKIGYTGGRKGDLWVPVLNRMRSFQTGNPNRLFLLKVIAGGKAHEQALHARFERYWVTREWFAPAPELLLYIWESNGYSPIAAYCDRKLVSYKWQDQNCIRILGDDARLAITQTDQEIDRLVCESVYGR